MKTLGLVLVLICANAVVADSVDLATTYRVIPDTTYLTADGVELKLDIYAPWSNL